MWQKAELNNIQIKRIYSYKLKYFLYCHNDVFHNLLLIDSW